MLCNMFCCFDQHINKITVDWLHYLTQWWVQAFEPALQFPIYRRVIFASQDPKPVSSSSPFSHSLWISNKSKPAGIVWSEKKGDFQTESYFAKGSCEEQWKQGAGQEMESKRRNGFMSAELPFSWLQEFCDYYHW